MQICLFGGAFDPPHLGHQLVAKSLLGHKICDEVWFVPLKQHPFGKEVEVNGHRVEMLKMILEPQMRIEGFELEHSGKSFSIDTLNTLSSRYPQIKFSWVIGSDNLLKFNRWKDFQDMLSRFTVYVYPRKGFVFEPMLDGMIKLDNFPEVTVSSTEVRAKIVAGQSITGLVDERVEQYIKENGLYK
ncbi:MAG: nicotinate (nicotinamide) nucleotide adenylyltransferase [Patescibacteria group bacterium]